MMMRLGLFFLLFTWTLVAAAPAYETSEEEALALRRIADFWQEGEVQITKNQIEIFLADFPKSPYFDTLAAALGDLFAREQNDQAALNYYSRIQNPAIADKTFLHRMQCLYRLGWHATLADECESFLKNSASATAEEKLQATYLLAVALYHQCLSKEKEPEVLQRLALRAKPYFEFLSTSELSDEVAGAFAHLCCILKDFEGAANVYLSLAEKSSNAEEMVFQAALLQSKYNKALALDTFGKISQKNGEHHSDAIYNQLVLLFEQGEYEKILSKKEGWLASVPKDRIGLTHLFIGKSLFSTKRYKEAALELTAFLESNDPGESVRPAIIHLIEAAYHANDLSFLDQSIERMKRVDLNDPYLSKALFCRALLLKKEGKPQQAEEIIRSLLSQFSSFPERPEVVFELVVLTAEKKNWAECRQEAKTFIAQYPNHPLAPYGWSYLIAAASQTASKENLVEDLREAVANKVSSKEEKIRWKVLLAKAHFEAGSYLEAKKELEALLDQEKAFAERANSELLLALCYRDGEHNLDKFCEMGEKALAQQATALSFFQQRIALFNGYLGLSQLDKAAEHLYAAFFEKGEIQRTNLLWLADHLYDRFEKNSNQGEKALSFLTTLLEKFSLQAQRIEKETLFLESVLLKLAKTQKRLDKEKEAIATLEILSSQYSHPIGWLFEKEALLLLGELYLAQGAHDQAEKAFERVSSNGFKRDFFTISAGLQKARLALARLQIDLENQEISIPPREELVQTAVELKNLVLQRNLETEPLHLEAALDYVGLQVLLEKPAERLNKKLLLLEKTKADFQSGEDLLSKDYHAARSKLPHQDQIYQAYMKYIESSLLLTQAKLSFSLHEQKELQAKAKGLLLQIRSEPCNMPLAKRVEHHLKQLEE